MYRNFFKRVIDLVVALLVMILLSPVFLVITVWLFIVNNGKPFFVQQRIGRNNKEFRIRKFKTMNDNRGNDGELLPDADRLTSIGRFVRKTSLDELPQLWNVFTGQMSLIGPRPLLVEYLQLYSQRQIRRHEVRPGITGWAQVNGRNAIGWKQKFDFDVYYVDHLSFCLDMKIAFKTLEKVFKQEGISSEGHVTMEKFKGGEE